MIFKFFCVDFQNYSTDKKCNWNNGGESISFIQDDFVPWLRDKNFIVSEIISDYLKPKGNDENGCHPGAFGYISKLPDDIKSKNVFIKNQSSPIWTRRNKGFN